MVRGRKTLMKDIYIEEGVFIDYSKPLLRGGNSRTKKDLDEKIKELKKEGWTVTFGKWRKDENEYFDYWYEAIKYEKIEEGECPHCKSEKNIPIIYGYPSAQMLKESKRGKIDLGGCGVTENDPNRFCKDCGNKFKEKRSVA